MLFVFSKCQFPSCTSRASGSLDVWNLGSQFLPCPPHCEPRDAQTSSDLDCAFETLPSIMAAGPLSISELAYFLINFPLSGFTFITSKCYSLSSTGEFMLPSSIHLPTPSANSHWIKDLIFSRNIYFSLTGNYTGRVPEVLPTLSLSTYWMCTWETCYLSLSFLLSSSPASFWCPLINLVLSPTITLILPRFLESWYKM